MKRSIWIGHDPREHDAFMVCVASIRAHLSEDIPIMAVGLPVLQARGLYQRPISYRGDQMWDVISDAPMSTEFAISRFLVPFLAQEGQALFMDCDMLVRADLAELFAMSDHEKAVQVVKHCYDPEPGLKMDGQQQTAYPCKNWSSVMLFNLDHPATRCLSVAKVNIWGGRALHQFTWLDETEIGALPGEWNHLVGVDQPNQDAKIVHFTLGIPRMAGYENCEFADEWRGYCQRPV